VCTRQAKARAARHALKCIDRLVDLGVVDLIDAHDHKGGALDLARESPERDRE
jgi:hypothetical protein